MQISESICWLTSCYFHINGLLKSTVLITRTGDKEGGDASFEHTGRETRDQPVRHDAKQGAKRGNLRLEDVALGERSSRNLGI